MQTTENNAQNSGSDAESNQPISTESNTVPNAENVPANACSQPNVIEKPAEQAAGLAKEAAQQAVNKGAEQIQQLGAQGAQELGNMVGHIMKPKMENQPPVSKDEKIYAAVSYVPFVSLVSIIIKPDSSFVRLHAKQGLLLALIFFFIGMFAAVVSLFGLIGQLLAFVLGLVPVAVLIVAVYSMYLSFMGYWWKIPVLGAVADVIPVEWMAKTSKENLTGQAGMAKEDYDIRQDALNKEKLEAQAPKSEPVQGQEVSQTPQNNVSTTTNQNSVPQQSAQQPTVQQTDVPKASDTPTETNSGANDQQ